MVKTPSHLSAEFFKDVVLSDDEPTINDDDQLHLTLEDALEFKMLFGKYRGVSLGTLVKDRTQREYLRWIAKWDLLRAPTKKPLHMVLTAYDNSRPVPPRQQRKRKR